MKLHFCSFTSDGCRKWNQERKKKEERERKKKSHWAIEMVALRCVEPAAARGLTQGVK